MPKRAGGSFRDGTLSLAYRQDTLFIGPSREKLRSRGRDVLHSAPGRTRPSAAIHREWLPTWLPGTTPRTRVARM